MNSGWSTWEQGMSDHVRDVTMEAPAGIMKTKSFVWAALLVSGNALAAAAVPASCDRQCLIDVANSYLGALTAKDASRVPLASDVKFVENAKRAKPGDGLWKTITAGPTEFRIIVPDPVSQQVAGIVMVQSEGKPAQLGFRLKLANGKITEAEHLIAMTREQFLPNLQTVRPGINKEVPYEYADSRGRLLHIAKAYYDALDLNNGSLAPFAADCERRENGIRTAPSGGLASSGPALPGTPARVPGLQGMLDCKTPARHPDLRVHHEDRQPPRGHRGREDRALRVGFSHFHHAMTQHDFPYLNSPDRNTVNIGSQPFDLPAMHIYKIWGGQIHEIEAMGFTTGYNVPTGWE